MDLSRRCRDFWGLNPFDRCEPFGTHMDSAEGMFLWPAFDEVAARIVTAVRRRQLLVVAGTACSAKSTAWAEARRRLHADYASLHVCQPVGLEPASYSEQTIYRSIKFGIAPPDGSRETAFARCREDRAHQARQLLEQCNADKRPVILAINDAHCCRAQFLLSVKRLWDDLDGFDRLLSVLLIGQPGLVSLVAGRPEINERTEIAVMPGLGEHLPAYVAHEWARVSTEAAAPPFDETAWRELGKLAGDDWRSRRDHPLVVNRIVSRALWAGWRIKQRTVNADLIAQAIREER